MKPPPGQGPLPWPQILRPTFRSPSPSAPTLRQPPQLPSSPPCHGTATARRRGEEAQLPDPRRAALAGRRPTEPDPQWPVQPTTNSKLGKPPVPGDLTSCGTSVPTKASQSKPQSDGKRKQLPPIRMCSQLRRLGFASCPGCVPSTSPRLVKGPGRLRGQCQVDGVGLPIAPPVVGWGPHGLVPPWGWQRPGLVLRWFSAPNPQRREHHVCCPTVILTPEGASRRISPLPAPRTTSAQNTPFHQRPAPATEPGVGSEHPEPQGHCPGAAGKGGSRPLDLYEATTQTSFELSFCGSSPESKVTDPLAMPQQGWEPRPVSAQTAPMARQGPRKAVSIASLAGWCLLPEGSGPESELRRRCLALLVPGGGRAEILLPARRTAAPGVKRGVDEERGVRLAQGGTGSLARLQQTRNGPWRQHRMEWPKALGTQRRLSSCPESPQ